jgi:uncharacterized protein YjbI with pentapeptide repeats
LIGSSVHSGGNYTTGITLSFSDTHLSGATLSGLNGTNYFSGNFQSNSVIATNGTYLFTVSDLAGNISSMTFTIDTLAPLFTGTTLSGSAVQSGGIYATGIRFIFSDAHLSGATLSGLNGTNYFSGNFPSNSVITTNGVYLFTVSDLAGNTIKTIN